MTATPLLDWAAERDKDESISTPQSLPMAEGPLIQRHKGVKRHGHARHGKQTPEYITWFGIINRCLCQTGSSYKKYGAKGIKVCQRWRDSFLAFLEDMGPKPSPEHSIDRFPNQSGHYEPSNCRWATKEEQMNNRRSNRRIKVGGETLTLAQLARRVGIRSSTIAYRLNNGWSLEAAISTTPNHGNTHV